MPTDLQGPSRGGGAGRGVLSAGVPAAVLADCDPDAEGTTGKLKRK